MRPIDTVRRSLAAALLAAATASALAGASGKEVYEGTCIACHGPDGKGALPGVPDFTRRDSLLRMPDMMLLPRVINGYQSPGSPMAMPPKGGNPSLTPENLKAALDYMRSRFAGGRAGMPMGGMMGGGMMRGMPRR